MYELSYPWGYPPQSDLPPEEIHLAVNCLVDWMKEGVDASQLAASLLIAAYLHACMTNIGYPFRYVSDKVAATLRPEH